jgi:hypothetical protein
MTDFPAASQALVWVAANKPEASVQHKAAFVNSVCYLVMGTTSGLGGPSIREHLCAWSLTGPNGTIGVADTPLGPLTVITPDGTLPRAGSWSVEAAIAHCAPLCFDPIASHREMAARILGQERCFDDDPTDLAEMARRFCVVPGCGTELAPNNRSGYCTAHADQRPDRKMRPPRNRKKTSKRA